MRILLVRPKPHKDTIGLQSIMICEPLELEYLAAAVKGKHQVALVDMILEKRSLAFFIREYQPEVVALTAYISQVNIIKEYAEVIKKINPLIKIIVGGVHAEVVAEDFIDKNIDFIVTGNGIQVLSELVDAIEQGVYKEQKSTLFLGEKAENVPNIHPDRRITERYRSSYYYVFHNPCALVKTSYGCPYTCSFCFCRQVTGDKYYERDIADVIEEIKGIKEPEIYIVDDNFLYSKKRVEKFCDLLEQEGINKRFLIYGRADFIAQNESTIERFANMGLRAVIVGLETAKEEELELYNKKSSKAVNEKAIEVLAKYNVDCYGTFILGIDWDAEDFDYLYKWLKKWDLQFINLQPFTPLPGTPLYDQYKEQLIIPREKYEQWDLANLVVKPSKISIRSYYYNILKIYFKLTLKPRSLKKNMKYGLLANVKLSLGVSRIIWQYIKKIIENGQV
ncbi:MAG: radical SAM protein [Peptococcaceae bacterium BICA1-8]|nr:MAG: radical SAM protein [Peptococcaceae bacterium BICA1-8]